MYHISVENSDYLLTILKVEVARNGSGAAEVPEFFKAFEVEA